MLGRKLNPEIYCANSLQVGWLIFIWGEKESELGINNNRERVSNLYENFFIRTYRTDETIDFEKCCGKKLNSLIPPRFVSRISAHVLISVFDTTIFPKLFAQKDPAARNRAISGYCSPRIFYCCCSLLIKPRVTYIFTRITLFPFIYIRGTF